MSWKEKDFLRNCARGAVPEVHFISHFIPSKNLPFPSFSKRGENRMETIPPLKKGDTRGFAFDFICHER